MIGKSWTCYTQCVGSRGQRVGSRGQRVSSRGQRVGSRGQRVGSRGQRVGSRGQRVSSRGQRVSSREKRMIITMATCPIRIKFMSSNLQRIFIKVCVCVRACVCVRVCVCFLYEYEFPLTEDDNTFLTRKSRRYNWGKWEYKSKSCLMGIWKLSFACF